MKAQYLGDPILQKLTFLFYISCDFLHGNIFLQNVPHATKYCTNLYHLFFTKVCSLCRFVYSSFHMSTTLVAFHTPKSWWPMVPNLLIKFPIWMFDPTWAFNVDNSLCRSIFAFSSMICNSLMLISILQSWSLFKNFFLSLHWNYFVEMPRTIPL